MYINTLTQSILLTLGEKQPGADLVAWQRWLVLLTHRLCSDNMFLPIVVFLSVNAWWWWYQTTRLCQSAESSVVRTRRGGTTWRTQWPQPLKPWWASTGMKMLQFWGCCMISTRCGRLYGYKTSYNLLWIIFLTLPGSQSGEMFLQQRAVCRLLRSWVQ